MIYILYILLVPINLVITLLALVIAPVLPLFANQQEGWLDNHSSWGVGPRLPTYLDWFMTPDNSLDGDATFAQLNPPCYLSQVKWLIRNPAYAFGLRYLVPPYMTVVYGDKTIKDNDNAKVGWCFINSCISSVYFLLLAVFMLIVAGIFVAWWMIMWLISQILGKLPSFSAQESRGLDD